MEYVYGTLTDKESFTNEGGYGILGTLTDRESFTNEGGYGI